MSEPTRCEAQVSEPPHYLHTHTCSRAAKVYLNGKRLCKQHGDIELRRGVRTVAR